MRIHLVIFLVISMQIAMTSSAAEVVFKDKSGRTLTKADIQNASGKFNWEIRSGKPVPDEARRLHELGRGAGQRGESKTAIEHFEKAAKVAPDWPYPLYDAAYTYLLMGDFGKAYELYKRVDDMTPRGFFTVKTAVHSLQREMKGEFPKGTYLYFLSIEWARDTSEKLQVANQLVSKVPLFAPAWKAKATLEDDSEKRLSYLEKGLKASPDVETRGFLLINKALVLHDRGRKAEALQILGELALDPTSPLDIEAIAKKSLAMIVAK
jgi:tetratricopeptide (TPR) repeat protein